MSSNSGMPTLGGYRGTALVQAGVVESCSVAALHGSATSCRTNEGEELKRPLLAHTLWLPKPNHSNPSLYLDPVFLGNVA